MIVLNELVPYKMIVMETGKRHLLREKMLHQKHESYRHALPVKNWVDWISTRGEKMLQTQKCTFEKKAQC